MSKVVFCKKVCFGVPEELLCARIFYILHASKHGLQYHIPTQKNSLFDLSEIDFVISNFLCQNVKTTVGKGGGTLGSEAKGGDT